MSWTPLNLTVRVGCNLACEMTVPTPVLFVLKLRLEGRVLVMQEKLRFGIGLPSCEYQDRHGNVTDRPMFRPGAERDSARGDGRCLLLCCRPSCNKQTNLCYEASKNHTDINSTPWMVKLAG